MVKTAVERPRRLVVRTLDGSTSGFRKQSLLALLLDAEAAEANDCLRRGLCGGGWTRPAAAAAAAIVIGLAGAGEEERASERVSPERGAAE